MPQVHFRPQCHGYPRSEGNAIAGDVPKTLETIRKEAQALAGGIGPAALVELENSVFSLVSSGLECRAGRSKRGKDGDQHKWAMSIRK